LRRVSVGTTIDGVVAFVQFRDDPFYSNGDQRVSTPSFRRF
jgi:hypothetical protein